MFGSTISIAALPLLAVGAAIGFGGVQVWVGVVLAGVFCVVAGLVSAIIRRDQQMLAAVVRRLASDDVLATGQAGAGAVLLETLEREIDYLSRRIAPRAALVEQLRRADTTILERLPDPVIVLAGDRSALRANAAARAAYGDDMQAVLRHPDLRAAIERSFTSGTVQTTELVLPVPIERDVHAAVVPMDPPLADGGQAILVLSDRTRERLVERMRADFVANVSHELRTPLASVIGFVETLRGPAADDPPAQQRFLGIMAEQGARMNRLIDDLLSLSRIELTEHQSPSEVVNLRELTGQLVAGFEPRLARRRCQVEQRFDDPLPTVIGDEDQLAQVLQNLLDNAVKYGREGGTILLTVEQPPSGGRWPLRPGVVIVVADQGAGIAREHLSRLTERFYRVDKGRSRAVGGTGLGLAIVKHIVNRHRGQLLIESEMGVGTTISVWLPLTQLAAMTGSLGND